jgi:hypothetical protein
LTKRSTIELFPTADSPAPSKPRSWTRWTVRNHLPSSTSLNWAKRLLMPRAPGGPRVAMARCVCGGVVEGQPTLTRRCCRVTQWELGFERTSGGTKLGIAGQSRDKGRDGRVAVREMQSVGVSRQDHGTKVGIVEECWLASLEVVERSLGLATEHSLPLVSGRVHTSGLPIARVARAGLCAPT